MDARALIKPLIPAALRNWQRERRKHKFYWSWSLAERAAGDAYADQTLNKFRVARAVLSDGVPVNPLLKSIVEQFPAPPHTARYGLWGAAGLHGLTFLAHFPNSTYIVVETPEMAALANAPGVTFTDGIPEHCDVFFSSGTLQCIAKPYEALEAGFRSAAKAVVLVRNSFAKRQMFRVHKSRLFENGDGPIPEGFTDCEIRYPNRTIQERQIHAIAKRHGFILAAAAEDTTGVISYGARVYGRNLAFTRFT